MPLVPIPSYTPLPIPPSSADPLNFDPRADGFLGALPQFQADQNAMAVATLGNAQEALTQASLADGYRIAASAAAEAAAASSNATVWISGTVYAQYVPVVDPGNYQLYRKRTPSSSTTSPPRSDPINWVAAITTYPIMPTLTENTPLIINAWYFIGANIDMTFPAVRQKGDVIRITNVSGLLGSRCLFAAGDAFRGVIGPQPFNKPYATIDIVWSDTPKGWV